MKFVTRSLLFALFCGGILFVVLGCEDKPNTDGVGSFFDEGDISANPSMSATRALNVYPSDVTLAANNDAVELKVLGGRGNVSWSVQDPARGVILTSNSSSATYRRTAAGDNVVVATDRSGNTAFNVIKQP